MFRRFLGTIFLYFYVIPAVNRYTRWIIHHVILDVTIGKEAAKERRERARQRSRQSHPSGSRR